MVKEEIVDRNDFRGDARRLIDPRVNQPPAVVGEISLKDLSAAMGMDYLENLRPEDSTQAARSLMSKRIAERYKALPLTFDLNVLRVAIPHPDDEIKVIDELPGTLGVQVVAVIAPAEHIVSCREKAYGDSDGQVKEIELANLSAPPVVNRGDVLVLLEVDEPEVEGNVRIVNTLLRLALGRASDIKIIPGELEVRVYLKIDGQFQLLEPPCDSGWLPGMIALIKVRAKLDLTETRRPLDGSMAVSYRGHRYDVRVATMPIKNDREAVALRILDSRNASRSLEEIGFDRRDAGVLIEQSNLPNGIILVTGPTGSGKTSTLYACLNVLKEAGKQILTIEDPVEYQVDGLSQSEVNEGIGFTFATALKASLRQNPEIILVGEIRDSETAQTAVRAALTGHLVFSTLHTNDAIMTVGRLTDMGISDYLLADSLRAVVAQRLVRRLCSRCAIVRPPTKEAIEYWGLDGFDLKETRAAYDVGCVSCQGGYKGRVPIKEILLCRNEISDAIRRGDFSEVLRQLAKEAGMKTMREDGRERVLAGLTTFEEVLRATI